MQSISYAIKYWTKVNIFFYFKLKQGEIKSQILGQDKIKPLFLRHEGYLGAIGAFVLEAEKSVSHSWLENYAGSSGFKDSVSTQLIRLKMLYLSAHYSEIPRPTIQILPI